MFAPPISLFGMEIDRYATPEAFYYLCLGVLVLVTLGYLNLLRSASGRSFLAVRDSEVSARALGVNVARAKTWHSACPVPLPVWPVRFMPTWPRR